MVYERNLICAESPVLCFIVSYHTKEFWCFSLVKIVSVRIVYIRITLPVQFRFYTTHWQNLVQYDNIFNSKVAAVVDHRINHLVWKSYTTKQKVDNVASIKKIYTKGWKGKLCVWQFLFAKEQRGRPQNDVIYWIGRILKYI